MQDKEMYREIEDLELKKKAYQKLLYLNKIKGQQSHLDQLKTQKHDLMTDREVLLEKREKIMAQGVDQSQRIEQLQAELSQVEQKLEKLAKLKKELMCSHIEAQSLVEQVNLQEDIKQNFEVQYGVETTNINKGIQELQKHASQVDTEIQKVQAEVD